MRCFYMLGIILILLFSLIPTAAQEVTGEIPRCSNEEFGATREAMITITDGIAELGEIVSASGANPTELSPALVKYEDFVTGYWTEVYPLVAPCIESLAVTYDMGHALNDVLNFLFVTRNFQYVSQAEPTAMMAAVEGVTRRAEVLSDTTQQVGETFTLISQDELPELDLPACTAKDLDALDRYVQELLTDHIALGDYTLESSAEVFAALLPEYDAFDHAYWHGEDGWASLPSCAESYIRAHEVGFYLDNALAVVALMRLSYFESKLGDAEVAQAYVDAATARAERLIEFSASLYKEYNVEVKS